MIGGRIVSRRELAADAVVHVLGLSLGGIGAVAIVVLAALSPAPGRLAPIIVYAIGLVAMLGCSAAYNVFRASPRRDWLRRFDHAAIFVMIAGTYTPFTTLGLDTAWSIGLTSVIWLAAATGVVLKLWQPRRVETISVVLYLALGWLGLVALEPLLTSHEAVTLVLILAGGLIYSGGVIVHLWKSLPYQNAIWHGLVLVAACVHYVGVLSVVLPSEA